MEEKKETVKSERFTYEQLEQIAGNLSAQVQQLTKQLQEANMFNIFKRLDYCFKVLELPETSAILLSPDFAEKCAKEIEELMTIPKEEEVKEE